MGGGEEEVVLTGVVVVVVVVVEPVLEEMTPPVPVVVPPELEHLFQVVTTQSLELELELVVLELDAVDAVLVTPLTLIKQSEPLAPALRHAAESPIIIRYSAAWETLLSPTRK